MPGLATQVRSLRPVYRLHAGGGRRIAIDLPSPFERLWLAGRDVGNPLPELRDAGAIGRRLDGITLADVRLTGVRLTGVGSARTSPANVRSAGVGSPTAVPLGTCRGRTLPRVRTVRLAQCKIRNPFPEIRSGDPVAGRRAASGGRIGCTFARSHGRKSVLSGQGRSHPVPGRVRNAASDLSHARPAGCRVRRVRR